MDPREGQNANPFTQRSVVKDWSEGLTAFRGHAQILKTLLLPDMVISNPGILWLRFIIPVFRSDQ